MTTKKTATDTGQAKKLKLKKETVKDLEVKGKASRVKGGVLPRTFLACVPPITLKTCVC